MSFYSSAITTRLIDPVFNTANSRAEFRLPTNTVVLSNMRLLNVGATSALLATAKYNFLAGGAGIITNMRLMDGNIQLDGINDVNRWLAFKNYTKNNTVSTNLNNTLSRNGSGYVFDKPTSRIADQGGGYDENSVFSVIEPFKPAGEILNLEEDTTSAWLSLRDLFPILGSVVQLNTGETGFKDLRLVIEFSKDFRDYAVELNELENLVHRFRTLQPLLCVDEMVGESPMKKAIMAKFEPISFNAIEQDRVRLPAVEGRNRVSNTFQLQGFNNKRVNRVCVQKVRAKNSANNSALLQNMGSPAMLDEIHQWRINGSNLYPYAISNYNETLALTNDVWGVATQPLGAVPYVGVDKSAEVPESDELIRQHFPLAEELLGETSYICANFYGQRINELQFTYERFAEGVNRRYGEAMTLLVFAEVQKVIVPSKSGGYIVSNL
jgi:hypothetical protein